MNWRTADISRLRGAGPFAAWIAMRQRWRPIEQYLDGFPVMQS